MYGVKKMKKYSLIQKVILLGITLMMVFVNITTMGMSAKLRSNPSLPLPTIIQVDDDYPLHNSIKNAVINAPPGSTIEVYSGTYFENNITVDKPLTIKGISHDLHPGSPDTGTPIVNGTGCWTVFTITADNVNISNLIITKTWFYEPGHQLGSGAMSGIEIQKNHCRISNTTLYGTGNGIFVNGGNDNHIENNTIFSNTKRGIQLSASTNTMLRRNVLVGNKFNLYINDPAGSTLSYYVHDIDTSNTVDGKPVYYLVNQRDVTVPSDAGYIGLINCDHMKVKNVPRLSFNLEGVLLAFTTNSTIENITVTDAIIGVHLVTSRNITVQRNTLSKNENGVYLTGTSTQNTITNNLIERTTNAITLFGSSTANLVEKNDIEYCSIGIWIGTGIAGNYISQNSILFSLQPTYNPVVNHNVYDSNLFSYSLVNNTMIRFKEIPRILQMNDSVSFTLSLFNATGAPFLGQTFQITTSPTDTDLEISRNGNIISGSFNITKLGLFSLLVSLTDAQNNNAMAKFFFFVEPTGITLTRYYLRPGVEPSHGQQMNKIGQDGRTMLFAPPIEPEVQNCGYLVQDSPDDIPNEYPVSILDNITISAWYRTGGDFLQYWGVQRYAVWNWGGVSEQQQSVPPADVFVWRTVNFTELHWSMDYAWSWYWFEIFFRGGGPEWMTKPEQPSFVTVTHQYTYSFSNLSIR
jgi:parallel beta-helix repeat protein